MTPTPRQILLIETHWREKTIPQLMEITKLTRFWVIRICVIKGFVPSAARKNDLQRDLHKPTEVSKKIKKLEHLEPEKKTFVRPKANYSNRSPFGIASNDNEIIK